MASASSIRTVAVLASGQGTNFEALAQAAGSGRLRARVGLLLCDRPGAPCLDRARRMGIEARVLSGGRFATRLEDEQPWIDAILAAGADVVLLAGFMRRLHAPFLAAFADRVLNMHPSLLPAFPGLDAIGQAWNHGARITGCTVHLVDETLDGGPILAQAAVEVRDDDTRDRLEARVHEAEHALYPQTVDDFLHRSWRRVGRRVEFGDAAEVTRGG